MKRKWTLLVSVLLCMSLVAVGCIKKEEPLAFTGDKTEEPKYQALLNAISPSAYDSVAGLELEPGAYISVIGKDNTSSYWKEIKRGVTQAAADLNAQLGYTGEDKIKVIYSAPSNGEEINEQVNILDEELARYPDALVIASIDAEACKVQFDLATENGIPIIALDSGNSYSGIQCTVKTDNSEATRTGAYKLCNEIGNEGEIFLFVHDSQSTTSIEREHSFMEEIENNHPNVKVVETIYLDKLEETKKQIIAEQTVAEQDANAEVENTTTKTTVTTTMTDAELIQYYLEKHPNVAGCFGTNATALQFAIKVSKQADKDLMIVGFDAGKEQIDALEKGSVQGLVVQNPFGMGYASVVAAARTIMKSGNEAVVNTGYTWVTQDNIEEDAIQAMIYE